MLITKSQLPEFSLLNESNVHYDYVDAYKAAIVNKNISIEDICKSFFTSAPSWVDKLLLFRNKIAAIFRLKTGNTLNKEQQLANFKCEPGKQLGLFRIFNKTTNEVILGEDDKHLNFRVSLYLENKEFIIITTTVKFNNVFGRLYFFPVRAFHKMIVPAMIKAMVKQLELSVQL